MLVTVVAAMSWAAPPTIQVDSSFELQNAIDTVPDGGIIELVPGFYTAPSGGFQIVDPDKSFTIRAISPRTAILDGAGNRPILRYIVLDPSERGWVHFEGLDFENGRSTSQVEAGGVTVDNGGATFTDCQFENNHSDPSSGIGGVGGGTGVILGSEAYFYDCVWRDNTSSSQAPALYVGDDSTAFIHSSLFDGNRSNLANHRIHALGGALLVFNSEVSVTNTRFEANEAGFAGGALYVVGNYNDSDPEPQAFVTVSNCSFVDNVALNHPTVTPPSPTEGGAVHAENQATVVVHNSRFLTNTAHLGGAVSLYRAQGEIHDSVFRGNQAIGRPGRRGFGGAIKASSLDTPSDGSTNHPPASLVLADSIIQGTWGGVQEVTQLGGGVHVGGDTNRQYGENGVSAMQGLYANRMPVTITNVIFTDLQVDDMIADQTSSGGAIYGELIDLDMSGCLIVDSEATGTWGRGGAVGFLSQSRLDISDTTFAGNSADREGGAVYVIGSELNMDDCTFVANEVSPGVAEEEPYSRGAAIFTSVQEGKSLSVTGAVTDSVFVDQVGLPIYDDDRTLADGGGIINDVRYNGNQFFNTTFAQKMYKDSIVQHWAMTTSDLNSLVVDRDSSTPNNCNPGSPPECTDKSQVANGTVGSEPTTGRLLAVPPSIIDEVAEGDAATATESFLGYAWSGSSATLNGQNLTSRTGLVEGADIGSHTLRVDGQNAIDQIANGVEPFSALTAIPAQITAGQSSTLQWQTVAGAFLESGIDWGVDTSSLPSGSRSVSPSHTRTFRLIVATEQGGAPAEATVYVDDDAPETVFEDGFESGNTSAWSSVVP
jgi:hypothetical protein